MGVLAAQKIAQEPQSNGRLLQLLKDPKNEVGQEARAFIHN